MAFKKGFGGFGDFQSLRVSTEFTAPHKIIDRLYQNRVYLDRVYLDRLYIDRVYRLPTPCGLSATVRQAAVQSMRCYQLKRNYLRAAAAAAAAVEAGRTTIDRLA